MLRFFRYTPSLVLGAIVLACSPPSKEQDSAIEPPVAEKVTKELVANGNTRVDNYYWMKLSDAQKNADEKDEQTKKVIDYLNAENNYLAASLKHIEPLQEKIYNEIVGRIKQTDESVPYKDNGYWYYTRYDQGQEYPIYCRKKGTLEAAEEILLNVNEMATGHGYYAIQGLTVSEDNSLLAYAEDSISRRRYTVYIKDLRTGKIVDTPISNTEGNVTWANDNKTFFYVRKDSSTLRSRWIVKHKLGTAPTADQIVSEEKDETFYTGIYKTKSRKYLVIWAGSTLTNYYQILDANTPDGKFREFSPRERGLEYTIDHFGDRFYVVTNLDAQNFRLMETPVNKTEKVNWKEKIAQRKDTLLEGLEIFKNYLVLSERANANTLLCIIDQRTGNKHYL
ncbi:MAG: oligopeptidase B, partial [Cyclobacteriaceae bacterium]|nr:oligopeptidase B [Cyclobacteriaceae bacterium]